MTEDEALPVIHLATPTQVGRLFSMDEIEHLILGDCVLSSPFALDALAFYARIQGVIRLDFWGPAARMHADRASELMLKALSAPDVSAFFQFEVVDIADAAEEIAHAAIGGGAFAALDPTDPLERRLIEALQSESCIESLQ